MQLKNLSVDLIPYSWEDRYMLLDACCSHHVAHLKVQEEDGLQYGCTTII
jgi:hypothetical protein